MRSDTATAAGINYGLIHHYFDSMDEVLAAAFESVARQDLAILIDLAAQLGLDWAHYGDANDPARSDAAVAAEMAKELVAARRLRTAEPAGPSVQ